MNVKKWNVTRGSIFLGIAQSKFNITYEKEHVCVHAWAWLFVLKSKAVIRQIPSRIIWSLPKPSLIQFDSHHSQHVCHVLLSISSRPDASHSFPSKIDSNTGTDVRKRESDWIDGMINIKEMKQDRNGERKGEREKE